MTSALQTLLLLLACAVPQAKVEERLLDTIREDVRVDSPPVFAAQGDRVGYQGVLGHKAVVVVDGEIQDENTFCDALVFSADGRHFAYRYGKRLSKTKEKWCVVVDGERQKSFDWVGPPALSADGATVAYWSGKGVKIGREGYYEGGKYAVMLGTRPGASYTAGDALTPPALDSSGQVVAYAAQKGRQWVAVVGEHESKPFGVVGQPVVSADGKVFVFAAAGADGAQLVSQRGKAGPIFQAIGAAAFGPRYEVAYAARENGDWLMVRDGRRLDGRFDALGRPVFSPDGKRLAFRANRGARDPFANLPRGAPRPPMPPEALAEQGGKWRVVVDGEEGAEYDAVGDPVFSPDGRLVAYPAREGTRWVLVVGEQPGTETYDHVGTPVFAPEGGRLGFGARRGRELWWRVVAAE